MSGHLGRNLLPTAGPWLETTMLLAIPVVAARAVACHGWTLPAAVTRACTVHPGPDEVMYGSCVQRSGERGGLCRTFRHVQRGRSGASHGGFVFRVGKWENVLCGKEPDPQVAMLLWCKRPDAVCE